MRIAGFSKNAPANDRIAGWNTRGKRMAADLALDDQGQDLVEYALLVAIVALGAVTALNAFKTVLGNAWTVISNNLSTS
jgi:pilus assembly protein Flp/PilA